MKESQSQVMVIKGYHTEILVFNNSEIMGDMLKKQKNIMFSGSEASHQNWSSEKIINTLVATERDMLMHATLKCTESTFSTGVYPMNTVYAV